MFDTWPALTARSCCCCCLSTQLQYITSHRKTLHYITCGDVRHLAWAKRQVLLLLLLLPLPLRS
jgi:hypothetical protein